MYKRSLKTGETFIYRDKETNVPLLEVVVLSITRGKVELGLTRIARAPQPKAVEPPIQPAPAKTA